MSSLISYIEEGSRLYIAQIASQPTRKNISIDRDFYPRSCRAIMVNV